MATDSRNDILRPQRNATVVAAIWILGLAALLEIVLAALALAPRFLASYRTDAAQSVAVTSISGSAFTQQSGVPSQTAGPNASAGPGMAGPPSVNTGTTHQNQSQVDGNSDAVPAKQAKENYNPSGPALQILSAKLEGSDEGSKKLSITIKSNPRETIDVPQVKVQVYFYDDVDGEISPSKAQVTSTWLSLPVNWQKHGEPELLEVSYLPDSADTAVRFAGYVVAIYYKGELQDCRADPSRLRKLFEPKYFIGSDE